MKRGKGSDPKEHGSLLVTLLFLYGEAGISLLARSKVRPADVGIRDICYKIYL